MKWVPKCMVSCMERARTENKISVRRLRHKGGAHGGRAPAKIVRVPAKITGLIMFHLGCQIKILVFLGIFGIKNRKRPNGNPVFCGGCSRRLSHTHSYLLTRLSRTWNALYECLLFLGSIDVRTWRGYRLPDGPHWQFQSGDGVGLRGTCRVTFQPNGSIETYGPVVSKLFDPFTLYTVGHNVVPPF